MCVGALEGQGRPVSSKRMDKENSKYRSLNVMSSYGESGSAPVRSEYDSKFTGYSTESIRSEKNPFANSKSSVIEVPRPPQFAWPLVDGDCKKETFKPTKGPNTAHSEYATQFTWHGLAETAYGRRDVRPVSAASISSSALYVIDTNILL